MPPPSIYIRTITPEATLPMRALVLSQLVGTAPGVLPLDIAHGSLHMGAFLAQADPRVGAEYQPSHENQQPIAVLSLYLESYYDQSRLPPTYPPPGRQMQLHKFAVHPSLQGLGIGSVILPAVEGEVVSALGASREHPALLHCDTRLPQVAFYQRAGYELTEQEAFVKYKETGVALQRLGKVVPC
jgi:GNAT superfamily N-acetyltransferase